MRASSRQLDEGGLSRWIVRFDERSNRFHTLPMSDDTLIRAIQAAYPQIWFACHVEHRTRREDRGTGLTDREAGILAHVGQGERASTLAKHLGIGKPALSQHLKELTQRGWLHARPDPTDGRRKIVELTELGRQAVSERSPLDSARLGELLALMPEQERVAAVAGLQSLAQAARLMRKG